MCEAHLIEHVSSSGLESVYLFSFRFTLLTNSACTNNETSRFNDYFFINHFEPPAHFSLTPDGLSLSLPFQLICSVLSLSLLHQPNSAAAKSARRLSIIKESW
jgi:hypothetical protein